MSRVMAAVAVVCLATACGREPFSEIRFESVAGLNSARVRDDFARVIPSRFEILESVSFEFRGHLLAILGYTELNALQNTIAFAAFTPAGLKVGEARSVGDRVVASFALNPSAEQLDDRKLAEGLFQAIRHVYFDRVPKEDAEVQRAADRFHFYQPSGPGVLEFVFGGARNALVHKRYREHGEKLWQATYFDYQWKESKLYPSRVVFQHYEQEYAITLRLKEIYR